MSRVWSFLRVDPDAAGLRLALDDEMKSNPDADWQQQKAGGMASGIQKGRRGNWRNVFTPRDRQIFREVAGQTLMDWGYDAG
jgi:hypothetical protein